MKRILSILLAIVFLTTNVGYSLATHYCGGKIHKQSFSFMAEELNCGMEDSEKLPCKKPADTIKKKCCENDVQTFKVTDEFQATAFDIKLNSQFIVAFTSYYIELFHVDNEIYTDYFNYKPPLPDKDIPVLIQSFLI